MKKNRGKKIELNEGKDENFYQPDKLLMGIIDINYVRSDIVISGDVRGYAQPTGQHEYAHIKHRQEIRDFLRVSITMM